VRWCIEVGAETPFVFIILFRIPSTDEAPEFEISPILNATTSTTFYKYVRPPAYIATQNPLEHTVVLVQALLLQVLLLPCPSFHDDLFASIIYVCLFSSFIYLFNDYFFIFISSNNYFFVSLLFFSF
jgi:hypothetical protein